MFQSLRLNSLIYIFHKGNKPVLEIGYVTNIPITKPKYLVPPTFGLAQEMVVDLQIKIGDQLVNYQGLPAQLDIADSYSNGDNVVISDNREAMNAEIISFKQKSLDIINNIDLHKSIIEGCDLILNSLNPEFAEKKQQQDEIKTLKTQMSDMSNNIAALTHLIEKLTKLEVKNELTVGNLRK